MPLPDQISQIWMALFHLISETTHLIPRRRVAIGFIRPVELYAVWWNDGELHEWPEQVLSIIGLGLQPSTSATTALAALASVAAEQGQRRYYGGVPIEDVTVAYGS